jgi:hypothetical protein
MIAWLSWLCQRINILNLAALTTTHSTLSSSEKKPEDTGNPIKRKKHLYNVEQLISESDANY